MIGNLYRRLCLLSPRIEVSLRKIYWHNVKYLAKFNPNKARKVSKKISYSHVNFDDIIHYLRENGIDKGSLLIVHSSYDVLECTGLSPKEIIDKLLDLIGETGTLAMPAIRKYKEEPKYTEILTTDVSQLVCKYDIRKTLIKSGLLPYTMVKRKDSEVSLHPLNPMVAVGPLAKAMMEHNLDGNHPSPHGPNSSWKYCYDHDAFVVGLGVDLDHYNTISHVNEEAFGNWKWSDEDWYRLRVFDVIDDEKICHRVTVKERKPEWGMLRFAELNANKNRNNSGIIKRTMIGNIPICIEKSRDYVDYLQEKNKRNFFYYI